MLDKTIIPTLTANGQKPTKGEIRYRILFLRATYGNVLNTWPKYAQTEYHELARQLRRLEFENEVTK